MNNKVKIIIGSILVVLTIIILNFKTNINLEIFKNTNITDKNKISKLLGKLEYGDDFDLEIKKENLVIKYNIDNYSYKVLEKNASLLFYLINDLKEINYEIGTKGYSFKRSDILKMYNDFKNIKIKDIDKRYESTDFDNLYLGNINGNIDIFDLSESCLDKENKLYENDKYVYYITCSEIDKMIVKIDGREYQLKEAIDKELIKIDDLFKTNIKITKEEIQDENIN